MAHIVDLTREHVKKNGQAWLRPNQNDPSKFDLLWGGGEKVLDTVDASLAERLREVGAKDVPTAK